MTTALITGATAGIGAAFAERFATRGFHLVLVARDEVRLAGSARKLRAAGAADVETLAADLSTVAGRTMVETRLAAAEQPVDVLVNNAGFGLKGGFLHTPIEDQEELLDVLVRAVLRLTHAALPGMVERGRGAVINVSSMAGFAPRGTYSSAKAWVTNFSESVAAELTGTGVRCMALCPGFTHTEFHERAEVETADIPSWMWLTVDQVVKTALHDLARGVPVSIPGAQYKVLAAASRYSPRTLTKRVSRGMSKRW
ncbi:MAG TPA: SDR family oxidoreductase [Actinocrinis sp.]|nr:SDR family oxidoreductase [Actinocrinis sp.]